MSEPGVWRRLHPLSPIVRGGRGTIGIVILLLPALLRGGISAGDLVPLGVIALITVLGFISWLVTRWTIDGDDLRIETGVLRRRSLRFPLSQVQAIDVVRPGAGAAAGRRRAAAADGRLERRRRPALVRGGRRGRRAPRPAAGARPRRASGDGNGGGRAGRDEHVLTTVPTARLIASILISDVGFYAEAVLVALVVSAAARARGRVCRDQRRRSRVAARRRHRHLAAVQPGVPADRRRCARRAAAERRPGRAHVRDDPARPGAGRADGRAAAVAAVRLVPAPGRPGRRTPAARTGDGTAQRRQLRVVLPVGRRALVEQVLDRIVPDRPQRQSPPPRRVRFKSPLRYRMLAWGGTDTCVVTTTGRLRRTTCWVPLEKVQSLRRVQGPVQRRLKLATVHVDTAGRSVRATLRDRDAARGRSGPGPLRRARPRRSPHPGLNNPGCAKPTAGMPRTHRSIPMSPRSVDRCGTTPDRSWR